MVTWRDLHRAAYCLPVIASQATQSHLCPPHLPARFVCLLQGNIGPGAGAIGGYQDLPSYLHDIPEYVHQSSLGGTVCFVCGVVLV
jgi:hypothetical protein